MRKTVLVLFILVMTAGIISLIEGINKANAASTLTVCQTGQRIGGGDCDYTTVAEAVYYASTGDTVSVEQDGALNAGSSVAITKPLTLECATGASLINAGTFTFRAPNITFQNCSVTAAMSSATMISIPVSPPLSNITINNITSANYATFVQSASYGSVNITNNTINHSAETFLISVAGTGSITGNEINSSSSGYNYIHFMGNSSASGSVLISNNTITTSSSSYGNGAAIWMVDTGGDLNITVSNNTIKGASGASFAYGINIAQVGTSGGTLKVQENTIRNIKNGIAFTASSSNVDVLHNVVYTEKGAEEEVGVGISVDASKTYSNVSIKYNIFQSLEDIAISCSSGSSISTMTIDYNAFYDNDEDAGIRAGCTTSVGTNSITGINTGLVDPDNDDFSLREFSYMIGAATGSSVMNDIGAVDYSGSRVTTITVDDDGVGVHFSEIDDAVDAAAPSGDTVTIAAGSYEGDISIENKSLTLTGAGSSLVSIGAEKLENVLTLTNVDNSTISGFSITGGSSGSAGLYIGSDSDQNTFSDIIISGITEGILYGMDEHYYSYNGIDYSGSVYIVHSDDGKSSDFELVDKDPERDISDYLNKTPQSWNLGLYYDSDAKSYKTFIYDDTEFPTQVSAEAHLDIVFGGTGLTLDYWSDDLFTYSDEEYTYNAPLEATPSIESPSISQIQQGAGIEIASSDENEISSTTTESCDYGVVFSGTASSNRLQTMTFNDHEYYDLYTSSTFDNEITLSEGQEVTLLRSSTGNVLGLNTAPTGAFNLATPATDGSGEVTISIEVEDDDSNDTKATLKYETDSDGACDGPWSIATIKGPITVDYEDSGGLPDVSEAYVLGETETQRIITSSGANTVTFIWDSVEDFPEGDGVQCIQLTVNDDTADQETPDTLTLTIDNLSPSGLESLSVLAYSTSEMTASWDEITESNFSEYSICYDQLEANVASWEGCPSSGKWEQANDVNLSTSTTLTTRVGGLSAGTGYYFKLWAFDTYGNEATADAVYGVTQSNPAPAGQGVSLTGIGVSNSATSSESTDSIDTTDTDDTTDSTDSEVETKSDISPPDETVSSEQVLNEKAAIEEATKTTSSAATNTVDRAIQGLTTQKEDEVKTNEVENIVTFEEAEVKKAIEEFDNSKEEVERIIMEKEELLESLFSGEVSQEEKEIAQKYIDEKTLDSLEEIISEKGSFKINVIDEWGNRIEKEIKDFKNIKIITTIGRTEEDIREAIKRAKEEGKEPVVIDGEKINDVSNMSLEFGLKYGINPFDSKELEKLVWGDENDDQSGVIIDAKAFGGKAGLKITGAPGQEVHATAIAKNKKVAKVKSKIMQANVLFASVIDNIESTGEEIYLGNTILDMNGRGVIVPEKELSDGEYYLLIGDENGIEDVSTLIVNNIKAPKAPVIELIETEKGLLKTVSYILKIIEKTTSFDRELFIEKARGELPIEDRVIIKGKADPNSTVYVIYKSHIITSALISDASQGNFEIEIPEELESGDHTILVYAYNSNESLVSNIASLLFSK
jgi:hypothetical protein